MSKKLLESSSNDKSLLALFKDVAGTEVLLTLYQPDIVLNKLQLEIKKWSVAEGNYNLHSGIINHVFTVDCIAAYVNLDKPINPCNGALEIRASAAKAGFGYGRYLYAIAMSLNSKNGLVSDRHQTSVSAQKIWKNYYSSNDIQKKKLDNVWNPQTPDPNDDCELQTNRNFLNYSYTGPAIDISQHVIIHKETMAKFWEMLQPTGVKFSEIDIQNALTETSNLFFDVRYNE